MFFRGLWGYLPANILQGLIGFATLIVFTRLLSPDDYGRYALAFGVSSVAQTLFFTWIEASMARFYPAERVHDPEAPALYGTLYRLFGLVVVLFAAICVLALWLWPMEGALKLAIGLGLGAVVTRSLLKMVQEQRKSEGRVGAASAIDMLQTAGGFAIGVACAWAGLGGGSPVLATGLIALMILPAFVREDWGRAIKGHFDPERAKTYFRYGFPVSASLILTLALYTADRFLIAHFLTEADAGAYHAGYSLASRILDVMFIWFGAAGGPAMVYALENGGMDALRDNAKQQFSTMAFVLFPATAGLILVAPPLGTLMIGEALRAEALSVTPLIAIGALLSGLTTYYFLQAFTLARKTKLLVVAMAIPAISNIVLNVVLIPRFGLIGAAAASALSFGLGLIGAWGLGRSALSLPVPLKPLLLTAAATAAMAIAVMMVPAWGGIVELTAKAMTGGLVYGALAWVLNLNDFRDGAADILGRIKAKVMP